MAAKPSWSGQGPPPLRMVRGGRLGRRLSYNDVLDLRFFWQEYESAVGFRAIDYANPPNTTGGSVRRRHDADLEFYVIDGHDEHTAAATMRARLVREALAEMPPAMVNVLYLVYGQTRRHAPFGRFGDIAPIVEYTSAAKKLASVRPGESGLDVRTGSRIRDAVDTALRSEGAAKVEARLRQAAEELLWLASDAYRAAK